MANKSFQKPKRSNPALEELRIKQIIKKNMDEAYHDGIEYGIVAYSVILCMVLHDKTKLTDEEVQKVLDNIAKLSDSIKEDYASIPDMIQAIKEEYNSTIDEKTLLKFYPKLEGFLNQDKSE